jgi:hypothetical protein
MHDQVTFDGLSWFRRRQRKLARGVLAVFCLTWLQLASLPCAMANAMAVPAQPAAVQPAHVASTMANDQMHAAMPAMETAEHCPYCPTDNTQQVGADVHAACAYPHDPQVDSRAGLALGMALPAVAPMSITALVARTDIAIGRMAPPATLPKYALAVRYCRFLK